MKKIFICLLWVMILIQGSKTAEGQDLFYQKYDWEALPVIPNDTCIDTSDQAIYLLDKIVLQYYFNSDNEFSMVETIHRIVLIRNKQAIDDFNKVFINVDTTADIYSLKARAVSNTGEVVMFNKDNIKEIKDEEEGDSKIFAIDGLTQGGVMELVYTIKRKPRLWGMHYFQSGYPRLNAEFKIICPEFLEMATHSVNGFPGAPGRLMDKERIYVAIAKGIPSMPDEEYANYRANLQMIEYTISANRNKSSARIYDYKQASQRYWDFYNVTSGGETKEIKAIIKSAKVNKSMSPEEMIRAVDVYVKTNFLIVEYISGISKEDISPLIKIKVLDKEATMKLYICIMKELEIEYQILLTSNRFQKTVSRNFESWNNLDEELLYFPTLNAYICPYSKYSRYNILPYSLMGNDGLYIKKIAYQGIETGVGKVQEIPCLPSELSVDSLFVTTVLPIDMSDAVYEVCYRMTGYRALSFLQVFGSAEDNEKEEYALPYMKIISDDCDVSEVRIENASEPADYLRKPVSISAKVKTGAPVEKAGANYLYNIGKLIGQQSQLYDEKNRLQPIEIEYQHRFYRILKVEIPQGFRVANPEILKMEMVYSNNGKIGASFKSSYEIKDKQIIVQIWENYDVIRAPIDDYKQFSEVINAAADFNKLTLILEREGQ